VAANVRSEIRRLLYNPRQPRQAAMNQQQWRRADDVFHAALDRAPDARPAFLDEACRDDPGLRQQVERLLFNDERAGSFLERPVVAGIRQLSPARGSLAGRQVGPYRFLSLLGAGGMGEVYRAHDARLGRDVAVKTLPPEFAGDPGRLARLRREARALAALNHPNIATIHGIEESGDLHYLVLELVEGETPRGPMPLDAALDLASQVADALAAAHERGIVHRDLKPANLKVTRQGRVKILDFGLAKAVSEAAEGTLAPAQAGQAAGRDTTVAGGVVGTPGYMSPEQARGEVVDERTDIWAFGCLLFELLTGRRAFDGRAVPDGAAAALQDEPGWDALPAGVHSKVVDLLRQCLAQDASRRLGTMADARVSIEDARRSTADSGAEASRTSPAAERRRRRVTAAVGTFAVAAVVITAAVVLTRSSRPSLAPAHFALAMPGQTVLSAAALSSLAVAADGTGVVYLGANEGGNQLYWHDLRGPDGWALEGTEGSHTPFLSPDGRWLAFYRNGRILKVALRAGHVPQGSRAIEVTASDSLRGAAWSADGTIVYATIGGGLWRVSADGGPVKRLTEPDPSREADHRWPCFLPGGRQVLFTIQHASWRGDRGWMAVHSLDTGRVVKVLEGGVHGRYLPTGHLAFGLDGVLLAVPFDLRTLAVGGRPTPVVSNVRFSASTNNFDFDVAADGTLVFARAAAEPPRNSLVWVTREGDVEQAVPDRRPYAPINFALSPDGGRVAASVSSRPYASIWIFDLKTGAGRRLGVEADCYSPIWSPDGSRVAFDSNLTGALNLYVAASSGEGVPERLGSSLRLQRPRSWSADGRVLAYEVQTPKITLETHILRLDGPRTASRWGPDAANVSQPNFSPDGRWLAYQSQESGGWEVWVRPFPGPGPGQRVSPNGGLAPLWRGSEIYYVERPRATRIMSRHVESTSPLRLAPARVAFALPFALGNDNPFLSLAFDVERGGRRILVVRQDEQEPRGINSLDVIANWGEDVKAKLRGR
jgi:serine/threonine-protein kinase